MHLLIPENPDIENVNETIVLGESNDAPSCSPTTSSPHNRNEICEKVTGEDLIPAASTIDNGKPINCLENNAFKRDPGRDPSAAKDFLLLGPYQPNIKFPTINHRHFCRSWYQRYK